MQEHIKRMAVEAGYHDLRPILTEREAAFHVAFAQAVARECAGVSEEIARRNPTRMTERQRAYLDRWGYHYVLDEWWFHVTLSGRLTEEQRAVVMPLLAAHLGDAPALPRRVTELCLFTQASPGAPFLIAERLPLLG